MAINLKDRSVASEMRDAFVDGMRAKDQRFMDSVMVRLVTQEGCHPDDIEPLMLEALEILKTKDHSAYEFWMGSCDCGLNLH